MRALFHSYTPVVFASSSTMTFLVFTTFAAHRIQRKGAAIASIET